MDDKNPFLDQYKKKMSDDQINQDNGAAPAKTAAPLRFEEKSEFVRVQSVQTSSVSHRRSSKKIAAIVIWSAVVLCAAIVLVWYLGRGITVTDLTDWTMTDAQLWADENNIRLQVEEQYNDEFSEGKIISQNPAGGTTVKKGSFLKVFVSLGHDLTVTLKLPDLMNMTKAEIDAWAAENFMTKVRITAEFSDKVESGKVIRFEINDATVIDEVKRNTPIYVYISKGKKDQTAVPITVPNFKQMTIPQCNEFAIENGINLVFIETYDDYSQSGSIIAQSAKADSKVNKGDTITLTLSKGKKITVPDFSAYSKQQASAIANGLGITVTTIDKYSGKKTGGFISQSIAAGTIYTAGDILELAYSLGNKVVLYSFVGQAKANIDTWARDLNNQGASITIQTSYTQSNSPKDQIIYQDKANTVIGVVSTIRITVSLGKMVFVPDLVAPDGSGYDQAVTRVMAEAICAETGIIPVFVAEENAARLPGEIWSQSVAAGTEVYAGSIITLKYRPANATINTPNFTGMKQSDIIAAGYMKIFNITFITADTYVPGYPSKVFQQSLTAGTTVAYGTAITLTVSPPAPTPTPTMPAETT